MERYAQVNVGRGDLNEAEWGMFVNDVRLALLGAMRGTVRPTETHRGIGTWTGDDGITYAEDSAHVSTIADVDGFALRTALVPLKARYRQDAIALILGSDLL